MTRPFCAIAVLALVAGLPAIATAQTPIAVRVGAPTKACDRDQLARVDLSAPAPAGGLVVEVSSSAPSVISVPATATAPAGATVAEFTIGCRAVTQSQAVTVTARTSGGTASLLMNVLAPVLTGITFKPDGAGYAVVVALLGPAPRGGIIIPLTNSHPGLFTVPTSVTIPEGSNHANFQIASVAAVAVPTDVTVTGMALGATKAAVFPLKPAVPTSIVIDKAYLGGVVAGGTITLSGPAGGEGVVVQLSTDRPELMTLPASVTVPFGQTSTRFNAPTKPAASEVTAQITATVNGVSKSAPLTLKATAVAVVDLQPSSPVGGQTVTGKVFANIEPGPAGLRVQLTSSVPGVAEVPTEVLIPAGQREARFTVATSPLEAVRTVMITAAAGGATATATMSVQPEGPTQLIVGPDKVLGGTNIIAYVHALRSDDSFVVELSSDNPAVTVPASITMNPGETTKGFPVQTHPVGGETTVRITGKTVNRRVPTRSMIPGQAGGKGATSALPSTPATVSRFDTLKIAPPTVTALSLSQTSVVLGATRTITATITLNGEAPAGFYVSMGSDAPTIARPERATMLFPAGSRTATFTVNMGTMESSSNRVTIRAFTGGEYGPGAFAVLNVSKPR